MNSALLLAGILTLSPTAFATTFGPIPLVDQAESSQYVARGMITSPAWVAPEPHSRRPHTYWRVKLLSQQLGAPLAQEFVVRQPGGTIGELGYHVAGAAQFSQGEDTFLFLRDTQEGANVKELLGLASGKYLVETTPAGQKKLSNGLGLPVTSDEGRELSVEEFTSLLERVEQRKATAADRNVFVNRTPVHEKEEEEQLAGGLAHPQHLAGKEKPMPMNRQLAGADSTKSTPPPPPDPFAAPTPHEASMSSSEPTPWTYWVAGGIALLGLLIFFLRRR